MVEGVQEGAIRVFKGIPYAAPPIGALRWQTPQPALAWAGVKRADTFSPICPQNGAYPPESPPEPMSEDCLTLNVWSPVGATKLPVMVWIYGGGLENGSGSTPLYAGDKLAQRGVVVVTFNYRLGVLGFLAHPELSKESGNARSGNYGFLDQIAALAWVHRNIAAFGGDPGNVTIFGQSSGSISISALIASPLAKGLFRRAIGQSGGLFEPLELDPGFALAGAELEGESFVRRAGGKSVAALRQLPAEQLLKTRFIPHFNVDGFALTKPPFDAYRDGVQSDVDLLLGTNADEGQFFLDKTNVTVANFNDVLSRDFPGWLVWLSGATPGATDGEARASAAALEGDMRFRWDMWAWARLAAKAGRRNVYFYQFSRTPPFQPADRYHGLGATHGMEMPYVFDHLEQQQVAWMAKDRELASIIPAYWTNFAITGDPNGAGLPRWQDFRGAPNEVMNLGDTIGPRTIPDIGRLERIDQIYGVARFVASNMTAVIASVLALGLAVLVGLFFGVRRLLRR
ncbi:MAG: carboxylesterase family protein [Alphaproteobacteria bacterium]|nr:carboxylesterase family protein [Alphaproteobacteria bacterium]